MLPWSFLCALMLCLVPALDVAFGAAPEESLDMESYVRIVLCAHPAIRQATSLDDAAAAESKDARLLPDPEVGVSRGRGRATEGSSLDGAESGISVTQTFPWPGRFAANIRAADRAADALRAEGDAARWEVTIEARSMFARLLHAREGVEISRAAETDALSLRDLIAKRAELGESREVDRIKAEVEWLRQQRVRRSLERESEAAEAVLRTLAVDPLPRPLVLAGGLPGPVPPVDSALLRDRLEHLNPLLRGARASAAREAALFSASRRGRVPDLDVTAFRNEEIDKEASGLSVGLRIPLWNAHRGEIARAGAASSLATAGSERTRVDLLVALERARKELENASGQAEILERDLLPAAARSLELARFSYTEGETSLLDLLDAQRTFRETQREAAASRLGVALALAEVQRLVGPDFIPGR